MDVRQKSQRGKWIPSNEERKRRIRIIRKNGYTPEQLAHYLWEGSFNHMDTQDIRSEILDILHAIHSDSAAFEVLEERLDDSGENDRIEYLESLQEEIENEEAIINEVQEKLFAEERGKLRNFAQNLNREAERLGIGYRIDENISGSITSFTADLEDLKETVESEDAFDKLDKELQKDDNNRQGIDAGRHGEIGSQNNVSAQEGTPSETAERAAGEGNRSGEKKEAGEAHLHSKPDVAPFGVSEQLRIESKLSLTPNQRKSVEEQIRDYDERISDTETKLSNLRKQYNDTKNRIGKRQLNESQTNLFGETKKDNSLFDVKSDYSHKNLTKIFDDIKAQIETAKKELSDLKSNKGKAIDGYINNAKSQTEISHNEKPDKSNTRFQRVSSTTMRPNALLMSLPIPASGLRSENAAFYPCFHSRVR